MIDTHSTTWQVGDITIRPGILPADIPHLVSITHAHDHFVQGASTYDELEAQQEFGALGFVIEESVRLAFAPDGSCVGIGVVYDNIVKVRPNLWGFVVPEYRDLGIGTALLEWQIARGKQNIGRVPDEAKITLQAWAVSHDHQGIKLFVDHGFTTDRCSYTMQIDFNQEQRPAAPVWPEGVELRSMADGVSLATVAYAVNESFRDHRGYIERSLEERMSRWETWLSNDPKLEKHYLWVAFQNGEVAGVCLARKMAWDSEDNAYVATLGTLRNFRKQGLASAMLNHTFNVFYDMGKKAVNLGVDGNSLTGAVRMYEGVGMVIKERRDMYDLVVRDGIELTNQG